MKMREAACPFCGKSIEIVPGTLRVRCPSCGQAFDVEQDDLSSDKTKEKQMDPTKQRLISFAGAPAGPKEMPDSVQVKRDIKKIFAAVLSAAVFCIAVFMMVLLISHTADAAQARWKKTSGHWRYVQTNGKYATGLKKVGKYYYYFEPDGDVKTGWIQKGKRRYYGWKSSKAGKCGRILAGWKKVGKYTYYLSKSTKAGERGLTLTGWQKIGGNIYYFGSNGVLRTGWKTIHGHRYYFNTSKKTGVKGRLITGWKTISNKKYYFRKSGALGVKGRLYTSEWVTIGKKKYYFNKDGSVNRNVLTSDQFIKKIGPMAQADMKKSGVLASVTIAQAILESGYGTTPLGMEANNLFGMKTELSNNDWASAWDGKKFNKSTLEYIGGRYITIQADFRAYSSYEESVADHSAYLTGAKKTDGKLRYKGIVGNKDYRKVITIIKNGGYATDPGYINKICSIIDRYDLTIYDR